MKKESKYNKSEIFKKAWKLVKDSHKWVKEYWIALSEALKRAWKEAKRDVESKEKLATLGSYFYGFVDGCKVHFNLSEGIVSGSTYRCKEILKGYGLKFNGSEKYWEGTPDQVKAIAIDHM